MAQARLGVASCSPLPAVHSGLANASPAESAELDRMAERMHAYARVR